MAGSSLPGPIGIGVNTPAPDPGTTPPIVTPPPGSVRTLPVAQPAAGAAGAADNAVAAVDAAIDALDLSTVARAAAYALKRAHPSVVFTSGRRSKEDQARAMAGNVVKNRKWIEQTYANSPVRKQCQDWVDANPAAKTKAEIAEGLLSVFNAVGDEALGRLSKHLSGDAFDVQPVDTNADAIKTTIRGLQGLDLFLDTEGGLVRWHAQF
jgi:hypothetical protein